MDVKGITMPKHNERNPFGDQKPKRDSCNEPSPANYDVIKAEQAVKNGFR